MMDVLRPLRVFLERDQNGGHWKQADAIMDHSSRLFSFTIVPPQRGRYLVPYLCGYGDIALWVKNDRSVTFDLSTLWKKISSQALCSVYVPSPEKWHQSPTLMLFRNKFCERLTPEFIYQASPEELSPPIWAGGMQNVGVLEV